MPLQLETRRDDFGEQAETHPMKLGSVINYSRSGAMADKDNIPEMLLTFEEIRRIDETGHEYWSSQATQFRIWATSVLNEFIVNGMYSTMSG